MNIIPILPQTLDIIEVLNNGIRPLIEAEDTFFVYKKNEIPRIITRWELELMDEEYWAFVKIGYLNK